MEHVRIIDLIFIILLGFLHTKKRKTFSFFYSKGNSVDRDIVFRVRQDTEHIDFAQIFNSHRVIFWVGAFYFLHFLFNVAVVLLLLVYYFHLFIAVSI